MFSSSDDNVNVLAMQIQATHAPDGREVDVRPLLRIIEEIFKRATPNMAAIVAPGIQGLTEALEDKTRQGNFVSVEALAHIVDRISCELACKCSGSQEADTITISMLNMLANYSWDAKLVLLLSAFALNYGEFWLVAQNYTSNQLAKSVAFLRQLPEILDHSSILKPQFEAVNNLVKVMLEITRCIVELVELPPQYITTDDAALSMALVHMPIAVYWTIRSAVACVSRFSGLAGLGHEQIVSTAEGWELPTLAHKISNMHSHLATQLATCYRHIDERKVVVAYQNLLHLLEVIDTDNISILKELICPKDDPQPLFDGATHKRVDVYVLRRKTVLLLISDLDILQEELAVLEHIYAEALQPPSRTERQFEVVWLPISDPNSPWTETRKKQFETLQASMQWYSVHNPSYLERAVIKLIKEVWNFRGKPILVVLDPQGQVANPNALHMMWIWGSAAFPFCTAREEDLWKTETWGLELLVYGIDPTILTWISEGRYICLYGGEDMQWIQKFTFAARDMAQAAGISLGMVYVGKSYPKERVRRNTEAIREEKLSHFWQDLNSVRRFWFRIESMWQSKIQLGRTVENDPVMQEVMTLMSFDGSEGGWALLSRGSAEMTKAKGSTFLACLMQYETWKEQAQVKGLVPAIGDHLMQLQTPHHCNRLVLPGTAGRIPERVVCSECGRSMEKFIMYKCCDD